MALVARDSPTAERLHRRAARPAVAAGALDSCFEASSRLGCFVDQRPGHVVEPDDHAARPLGIVLLRVLPDVDVDETPAGGALDVFAKEVWLAVLAFSGRDGELEG